MIYDTFIISMCSCVCLWVTNVCKKLWIVLLLKYGIYYVKYLQTGTSICKAVSTKIWYILSLCRLLRRLAVTPRNEWWVSKESPEYINTKYKLIMFIFISKRKLLLEEIENYHTMGGRKMVPKVLFVGTLSS